MVFEVDNCNPHGARLPVSPFPLGSIRRNRCTFRWTKVGNAKNCELAPRALTEGWTHIVYRLEERQTSVTDGNAS